MFTGLEMWVVSSIFQNKPIVFFTLFIYNIILILFYIQNTVIRMETEEYVVVIRL